MRFLTFVRETSIDGHVYSILLALLFSVPMAGFGCGVSICDDCSLNPIAYLLMGLFHAVITTVSFGKCWVAHSTLVSVFPYVPVTTALGYFLIMLLRYKMRGTDKNVP